MPMYQGMPSDSHLTLVSTRERPDLAPLIAQWLWEEFWHFGGYTLQETLDAVLTSVSAAAMPRTFILLDNGEPVGTASLAQDDLDTRPDLSPWLAGVIVIPQARRKGYATHLVAAVEDEARAQGVKTLWLYTHTAEHIYARIGWITVERFLRQHGPTKKRFALMRRDLE